MNGLCVHYATASYLRALPLTSCLVLSLTPSLPGFDRCVAEPVFTQEKRRELEKAIADKLKVSHEVAQCELVLSVVAEILLIPNRCSL